MRALLPSVWELDLHYGCDAVDFEHNHTVPIWTPQLKRLYIDFLDLGAAPSVAMLESMPARRLLFQNRIFVFGSTCGPPARHLGLEPTRGLPTVARTKLISFPPRRRRMGCSVDCPGVRATLDFPQAGKYGAVSDDHVHLLYAAWPECLRDALIIAISF